MGRTFLEQVRLKVCAVVEPEASCTCLLREKAPPQPDTLPFQPCKENIEAMKEWLLKCYAASPFN